MTPPANATSLLSSGQAQVVVDIVVTDSNGVASLNGSSDRYFFAGLAVTRVSPARTRPDQPIAITITGSGFGAGPATVGFYAKGSATPFTAATNVQVVSDTTITATTPNVVLPGGQASLATDLRVTVNGATSPVNIASFTNPGDDTFSFGAVSVTAVRTLTGGSSGPVAGSTPITISGSGFGSPGDLDQVTLLPQGGGAPIPATNVAVVNDTTVTA